MVVRGQKNSMNQFGYHQKQVVKSLCFYYLVIKCCVMEKKLFECTFVRIVRV